MFGDGGGGDESSRMDADEEREDLKQLTSGRQKRAAWGARKHAAPVEALAYRIVWISLCVNTFSDKSV